MSREGSYEYEMEKLARMVLTVCHKHRDKFFRDDKQSFRLELVKEHIDSFFDVNVKNEKFYELEKFYPAVFEVNNFGGKPFALCVISINKEYADILEIW